MRPTLSIYALKEGEDFRQLKKCPRAANLLATALATQAQWTEASTNLEMAKDTESADFVLYPYGLDSIYDVSGVFGICRYLKTIRNFAKIAHKTIFFWGNDLPIDFAVPSIFIRQSVDTRINGPNTIAFPYLRDDLGEGTHFDWEQFKFETSFVGYIGSSPVRFAALESFYAKKHTLRFLIKVRDRFFGHKADEKETQKEEFVSGLRDAMTVLCPRGTATNSFRFFEALCMGRIPVLISDNCGLPFAAEIPYRDLIIWVPETKAGVCSQFLEDWIGTRTRDEILERCRGCRGVWESHFSKAVAIDRLLGALAHYKEKLPAISEPSPDWFQILGREEQLFRSLQMQCDECLKKGDDVNALHILMSVKGILAVQNQGSQEIDKSIAALRLLMTKKISIYSRYFAKIDRSGNS